MVKTYEGEIMTGRSHTPEDIKKIESKFELSIWEKAMGWRKRQMVEAQINEVSEKIRNDTLEEVAKEFDKMKPFGDTAQSFATYVRMMKR
jgi:hypothetical protein